jgi:hypothetical protein
VVSARVGGDPIILGALDRSLIDEVIKRNMNQIRYCYQRELTKNPALGGKIVDQVRRSRRTGRCLRPTKSTTMGNASAESCIVGRFSACSSPSPRAAASSSCRTRSSSRRADRSPDRRRKSRPNLDPTDVTHA